MLRLWRKAVLSFASYLKVKDVKVFAEVRDFAGFRNHRDALLHDPAQRDLRPGLVVARADPSDERAGMY